MSIRAVDRVWPAAWLSNKTVYYYLTLVFCGLGTAWWGEHPADPIPTATYMATLLFPALVYPWLEAETLCNSAVEDTTTQHRIQQRKTAISILLYAAGMALAFVDSAISIVCTFLVSMMWVLPGSRIAYSTRSDDPGTVATLAAY